MAPEGKLAGGERCLKRAADRDDRGNCNAPRGRRYTRKMKNVCESIHVCKGEIHPLITHV